MIIKAKYYFGNDKDLTDGIINTSRIIYGRVCEKTLNGQPYTFKVWLEGESNTFIVKAEDLKKAERLEI